MKQLLVFLFLLCSASLSAQDVIVKKDGSTILSKVLEVGQDEIKYKKFDNLEGPTYTIQKSELQSINYQNGAKDTFSAPVGEEYLPNNQNDGEQRINDKALLQLDAISNNSHKKINRLKTIGWIGGGTLFGIGIITGVVGILCESYDEMIQNAGWTLPIGIGMGGGILWTASFQTAAYIQEKEIKKFQTISLLKKRISFSNGSSISLGTDLLSDRTIGSNTLGLGLRYNF